MRFPVRSDGRGRIWSLALVLASIATGCSFLAPFDELRGEAVDGSVPDASCTPDPDRCGPCGFECAGQLACGDDGRCAQHVGRLVLGYRTSCVLLEPADVNGAREARCWGNNEHNLLRDVSTGTDAESYRPLEGPLSGIGAVRDVAIGRNPIGTAHGCALDATADEAICWGDNSRYQLGTTDTDVPVDAVREVSLPGAIDLEAALDYTCALLSTGEVRCWGSNDFGQLGDVDSSNTESSWPVTVDGIDTATQIAVGGGASCAILEGGELRCWGIFANGAAHIPITDAGGEWLVDATFVRVGGGPVYGVHGCAIRENGRLVCWGTNLQGELGLPSPPAEVHVYGEVPGLDDVIDVATGFVHTCALVRSGQVYCWGHNPNRQLVAASTDDVVAKPEPIAGLDDAIDIESAGMHTCARRRTGQTVCWGENSSGELGDETAVLRLGFVAVHGLP